MIAETEVAAAHGALYTGSGDLASLTGHPATTLSAAVGVALRVFGDRDWAALVTAHDHIWPVPHPLNSCC
jgi:hypothetical protein